MVRNLQGEIPDDHFENEPCGPPKNVSPMSDEMKKHIEKLKAERDKYQPGDVIGGY